MLYAGILLSLNILKIPVPPLLRILLNSLLILPIYMVAAIMLGMFNNDEKLGAERDLDSFGH